MAMTVRGLNPLQIVDGLLRLCILFPLNLTLNFVRVLGQARTRGLSILEYIAVAILRTALGTFSLEQIANVPPGLPFVFSFWAGRRQRDQTLIADGITLKARAEDISDGDDTQLHWIENAQAPAAKKVILFLHGGGYIAPILEGHLDWCFDMLRYLRRQNIDASVAVLHYRRSPRYRYPTQLRQVRTALTHLLSQGFQPKDIVVGGDSAGGNLAINLVSLMLHPHPTVGGLKLEQPLAGVFLVSPWLSTDLTTASFRDNNTIDMLSAQVMHGATQGLVPDEITFAEERRKGQGWAFALHAKEDWWSNLPKAVDNVYITAGEHEVFRDHIIEFATMLREHPKLSRAQRAKIVLSVGALEAHDHILTWSILRSKNNPALDKLNRWMLGVWTESGSTSK